MAALTIWHLITYLCLCCQRWFLYKSLMGNRSGVFSHDEMWRLSWNVPVSSPPPPNKDSVHKEPCCVYPGTSRLCCFINKACLLKYLDWIPAPFESNTIPAMGWLAG